ncbi:MAG: AAA family ATPase, partial [Thermomicrobiales bacterium]
MDGPAVVAIVAILLFVAVAARVIVPRLTRVRTARRQAALAQAAQARAEAARLAAEQAAVRALQEQAEAAERQRRADLARVAEAQRVAAERERQERARQQRKIDARAAIRTRIANERREAANWRETTRLGYPLAAVMVERSRHRGWATRKAARQEQDAAKRDAAQLARAQRTAVARAALGACRDAWDVLEQWPEYMSQSELAAWREANALALQPAMKLRWALPARDGHDLRRRIAALDQVAETVARRNAQFVERRLEEERARFDTIERFPLADQQRRAVVTNEDAVLVVAGAGTGKTSTVVSRVDYLIRRGLARPEQILVVAYNRSAATELRERFTQVGIPAGVSASTFHALGSAIVGEVTGARPRVSSMVEDIHERLSLVRTVMTGMLADAARRRDVATFLADHLDEQFAGDGNSSADAHIRAERARGLRCITGKLMRSREEVQIANWMTLYGITWEHEKPYKHDTATPWKRSYLPD